MSDGEEEKVTLDLRRLDVVGPKTPLVDDDGLEVCTVELILSPAEEVVDHGPFSIEQLQSIGFYILSRNNAFILSHSINFLINYILDFSSMQSCICTFSRSNTLILSHSVAFFTSHNFSASWYDSAIYLY
ncbi:hypothetical protein SETIT_9G313800v2 [Setaria italica]|uniref:Uncharacterized protein n=1 Tax=Setaria italica TaxID=4555 RepID=A0A368SMP0_SETIT|nr:hypothetical protein SETIT_9G313800v2 [Setaria italica]